LNCYALAIADPFRSAPQDASQGTIFAEYSRMDARARAPRVLIVDDQPSVLRAMRRGLADEFDVHTAASGHEGLQLLETSEPFSAVVADYVMRDMNGSDFLNRVSVRSPHTARILISGSIDIAPDDLEPLTQFFPKPFDLNALRAALHEAVSERQRLGD
jgi:DNA-binding NtrC family response regulator